MHANLWPYICITCCAHSSAPCIDGQLRLAGGNVDNEGRVEICLNNEWGTICDDNWSVNDANVACSVLGFSNTGEVISLVLLFSHAKLYTCTPDS